MEDTIWLEFQQTIRALTPKPTELDLLIRSSGREHEAYASVLIKIEKAVQSLSDGSKHKVCHIVIEWLTRKTSESWAKCIAAVNKDYELKKYRPIGYSPIGE